MAIAAPPQSTAISAGSKEAPISLAPVALIATPDKPKKKHQKMFPPTPLKGEVFNPQVFKTPQDLEGINLLSADPETLTENERSRFGELKVARVAIQTLGDALSEVEVVGWRGKNLDRKRDIKLTFKDGRQREIEVKYGIAHDGQELQRTYMRTFRDEVPEVERGTRAGRNKAMWKHAIMLVNGAKSDEEIAESIKSQLDEIDKLVPVVVYEAEPKVDIGQLAFSGTATPDDVVKWVKQNPY